MFALLRVNARRMLLAAIVCAVTLVALSAMAAQFISTKMSDLLGTRSSTHSLASASCNLTDESQSEEIHFAGCAGFF
ncbi:hypothetical protein A2943_00435 [Candidatus Adlerbacteria bacterium RIFCSPLOWO2_01_FULL_51_16]|uniref:MacB-like periplasmic core domain-containing protein n=1 Tax=Candidatus Adlerbacteria bacterium RIFCSPLOWO2_01_FULL_51_16 TaxID=1797243 RepID=A0A1F4XHV3_9BACT|nr:MAG: hypothetical protein A2943_00435 [Candidatus Adlerbacteria bacterium RIFCSPLOWO2_01_FULL_51_16]